MLTHSYAPHRIPLDFYGIEKYDLIFFRIVEFVILINQLDLQDLRDISQQHKFSSTFTEEVSYMGNVAFTETCVQ